MINAKNIPELYNQFKIIQNKANHIALVIRHAEKNVIKDGNEGMEIRLTEYGRKMAKYIAKEYLKGTSIEFYVSPIYRCIETAERMIESLNTSIEITKTKILGHPGPYVIKSQECGKIFRKYGTKNVVKRFIKGENFNCMVSVKEGSKKMMNYILDRMKNSDKVIQVYITHDAILLPFFVYYTGYEIGNDWIDYLDGGIIYTIETQTYIYFKDKNIEVKEL